jgi:Flp pilus assembly protein TadD
VNPQLALVLVALLYVLLAGGLAALRREGFSLQFMFEVLILTGLMVGLSLLSGWYLNPAIFLIIIYLLTMRSRWLVDLGNALARRGRHERAARLYDLALKLKPDAISRLIVVLNQGVHQLQRGQTSQAVSVLESLLARSEGDLSPKWQAAARYNLGVAHQRQGNQTKAVVEFNKAIDVMPGSLYAIGAQKALERGKQRKPPSPM